MKIAVITYDNKGAYASNEVNEDVLVDKLLGELALDFSFEIWSDPNVNWKDYSLLLIKSPWDYFDRYAEFRTWCQKIQELDIPTLNAMDTVLWNSDKWYLKDIQDKGFPIVPTHFLKKKETFNLEEYFKIFNSDTLVIKPTVSGGAKKTLKLKQSNRKEYEEEIKAWLEEEDFMIQPFMDEVAKTGEYSYIFFNSRFSHAVLKSPKKGEFRVQHFFGGEIHSIAPTERELGYMQQIVDAFAQGTLYARVDGVWKEEVFYLMELELIEPYLFLFTSEKAQENYKKAIADKIKKLH
ncbi:ATP-grasp domain-containing protein [Cecembia calidifontis]|jgi:glutathione synthase/RimK-type ligase-like ATP-grasp enzyme|uniref:Glutathione synthetase-like protein n=1 Tax=Cecembia calidifontis TaxID=1187080 RepID=A0A4Q7PC97_9BACT|nr:glutathione synthetase [Cecembia calidifontis]RZS97966.1 glutathione synthetase-like protein [Cecembia calidifontis]